MLDAFDNQRPEEVAGPMLLFGLFGARGRCSLFRSSGLCGALRFFFHFMIFIININELIVFVNYCIWDDLLGFCSMENTPTMCGSDLFWCYTTEKCEHFPPAAVFESKQ